MSKSKLYVGLMLVDGLYQLYLSPVSADAMLNGIERFESEHMTVRYNGSYSDAATAEGALNKLRNILVAGGAEVVME